MAPQPPAPPPLASKDVSSHIFSLFSTTFQAPKTAASSSSKTPSQARAAKANEESDFSKFGRSNDGIGHAPGKKEVEEDQSTADLRKRMLGRGGKKLVVGDWNRKEKERAAAESSDEEEGRSGLGRGKKRRRVRQPVEEDVGLPVEEVRGGETENGEAELVTENARSKDDTPTASGDEANKKKKKKNKKNKKRKIEDTADS